ncbi:MAG: endonuclease III domain-containing protein [Dehalococcoidia bacterium]
MNPKAIVEALSLDYGMPRLQPSRDALAELVLTVLSQNTSDANSGRAFIALMSRYSSWDDVMKAPEDELVETIRTGGLAQQKAPRIQAILRDIKDRGWGWGLEPLAALPVSEAEAWLTGLPGVGPKTAACVLLFGLGRAALPVDTHVARVAQRLGLVSPRTSAIRIQALLTELVEPALFYSFHMLLIKHGRRTCKARRPLCDRCRLVEACPAAEAPPAP